MQNNLFENGEISKNIISPELLAEAFGLTMQDTKKVYERPSSEEKIKFLIGVFLIEKKILKRKELGSEKSNELIDEIYTLHIEKRKQTSSDTSSASSNHPEIKNVNPARKKSKQIDPFVNGLEEKYKGMKLYE